VFQVRALVVVPSQELASQVLAVFEQLAHGTGLSVARISGHLPLESECALLRDPSSYPAGSKVDILIATPGRLVEHLERLVRRGSSVGVWLIGGVNVVGRRGPI